MSRSTISSRSPLALATFAVLFSGCSAPPPAATSAPPPAAQPAGGTRSAVESAYEEALGAPDPAFEAAFERLKGILPKVEGDFVTEGDLLRTEAELRRDIEEARRNRVLRSTGKQPTAVVGPELVAALKPNGSLDFWDAGRRTLTYSIDRRTFADPKQATLVETSIKQATADWEAACTQQQKCEIRFVFRNDAKPTHKQNTFIVKQVNSGGAFIAAAFFPSYPSARRFVNIDPSFFSTSYDKTGVLRHELGHVLGYRHEHIRDILGCRLEGTQWVPITAYDPHSVMHYMCGGGGTLSLQLTDLDKQGHARAYGGL